jgi:acyl-CoA synthetase (AMP-forming)/AMP-acid ligase II
VVDVTGRGRLRRPDRHVNFRETDHAAPDPETLREHCRAHLAAYKVPVEVVVVDAMPLNASGKILKRRFREELAVAAGVP